MTDKALWSAFRTQYPQAGDQYEAWAFGGDPDGLARLVMAGVKTATASALPCYEAEEEPIPRPGDYSVILDSSGQALCVIRTTRVYVLPFDQVTEAHARKEGEGNKSLAYWRQVHEEFFTRELASIGQPFTPDMPVVCAEF